MLETIRGLVRPVTTFLTVVAAIAFEAVHVYHTHKVEEWFIAFVMAMWLFWYKDRAEERRNNNRTG